MLESVKVGNVYRNKKNSNEYLVLDIGKNTEGDMEDVVIYVRCGQIGDQIWVRPLWLFKEKFEELDNNEN